MAVKVSGGDAKSDAPVSNTGTVVVKERYEVHSGKPIPELDSQPAVAYACNHLRDPTRKLFALVCDPKMPPRMDVVAIMRRVDHRNLLRALDYDVIDWAPEGRRCPVLIMERPAGTRVFKSLADENLPMQEENVTRYFIDPVCQILREMHAMGTFHRMIRPDNLFWMGGEGREMILGECYSSQPGVTNPSVYETMECALSSVAGRGEGGSENDLYAVGVTILALLTGKNPLQGHSDDEIIALRHAAGSYGAFVQNQRISLTMMEPLRGLLNDEPAERWTLEELALWLNGRRLSPKQQAMPTKASRGLIIGGGEHVTSREVARGLHQNWDLAGPIITGGSLDVWLRRSLSEDDMVEAVNDAKAGGAESPDKLIARVIIALDPEGPIRLKDFSATLDGVSGLIGAFADDPSARKLFAAVINMSLMSFWSDKQPRLRADHIRRISRIDRVRAVMNQTSLGFGMERVVYELNAGYPCLSKIFERDFVHTVDLVLPALNRVCAQPEPPDRLIDRHVAAFLATHFKRPIGTELRDLERSGEQQEGLVAQFHILTALQETLHRNTEFPELCAYAAKKLEPATERFYSRERRKKVVAKIRKAAKSGKLQDLMNIIDDNEELAIDQRSFDHASQEYAAATRSLIRLTRDMQNKEVLAEDIGGQLAGAVSLLACIVTVGIAGTFALF